MSSQRNYTTKWLLAISLPALMSTAVYAQTASTLTEPPKAPDGWVYIDEDVWEVIPDTTERHLHEAQRAFLGQRYQEAAEEMRKAAAVVLFDGRRETNVKAKTALMDAALDLERLANNTEQRLDYSRTMMDHTFARTECALARHDVVAMRKAWQGCDPRHGQDRTLSGRRGDPRGQRLPLGGSGIGCRCDRQDFPRDERRPVPGIRALPRRQGGSGGDGRARGGRQQARQDRGSLPAGHRGARRSAKRRFRSRRRTATYSSRTTSGTSTVTSLDGCCTRRAPTTSILILRQRRATCARWNPTCASRRGLVDKSEVRDDLLISVDELRGLASEIERGDYIPTSRFNHLFARIHYNLARVDQKIASDAWAAKDVERARESLDSAMTNLKQGFVWSGHEMEASAIEFTKKVESLCSLMVGTTGWKDQEVQKAIIFVGVEVNRLGEEL